MIQARLNILKEKSVKQSGMKVSYRKKENLSEEEIVMLAKEDPRYFEFLYKKYYQNIFLFINRRTNREQLTKDICQDTFVKAMLNIQKFEFRGYPFSAWLYRIAANELNQYFRKNNIQRVISFDANDIPELLDIDGDQIDKDLLIKQLMNELDHLKDTDLMLIEMHFFEKRSYKDISEILGIKEGNAKVKVHRIKERIRKRIKI
jgi:RNA polymerase sigma-70 factor (ECF subfamily)